jgi:hypothetical protein
MALEAMTSKKEKKEEKNVDVLQGAVGKREVAGRRY